VPRPTLEELLRLRDEAGSYRYGPKLFEFQVYLLQNGVEIAETLERQLLNPTTERNHAMLEDLIITQAGATILLLLKHLKTKPQEKWLGLIKKIRDAALLIAPLDV